MSTDSFTFNDDDTFEMTDLSGSYTESGDTFTVNLNSNTITADLTAEVSNIPGYSDVKIGVPQSSCVGSLTSNTSIKGTWTMEVAFDGYYRGSL